MIDVIILNVASFPKGGYADGMPHSLHRRALEHLGNRIVSGSLPAGHIMLAEQLERDLGVSRSVVREAVRVLQSLGMVASTKRVGIRVLPATDWNHFDPQVIRWRLAGRSRGAQLRSLTELRTAVEPMAAALAADHAPPPMRAELEDIAARMLTVGRSGNLESFLELDILFHARVLASSGNEMYGKLDEPIAEILRGRTELGLMPDHPHEHTLQLHLAVAESIGRGDADGARSAMAEILRRTMVELESLWADEPRLFPQQPEEAGAPAV